MRLRAVVFSFALAASVAVPLSGQRTLKPVIVVFHDDVRFQSFLPGLPDARFRANPKAWAYLDRLVLGAVHLLENQYGFQSDHVYSATVRGFAARLSRDQIEALRRDPLVAYVEHDTPLQSFEQVVPWGIDRIGAAPDPQRPPGAATVNVYVLDNGIERPHAELNVVNFVNFTTAAATATCAHGTRVSGVLAARNNDIGVVGVLPGAPLTAVKVTTCDPVVSASVAIKGVDWVTNNAVRPAVANMSIGGFVNSTLDAAVKRSADSKIVYVLAAGNSSMDACWTSPQRAGTHGGVITVAATAENDAEASFSNYGRCVDIWGPGVNILTTELGGGTVTSAGTSYAAPHVAGTAGRYLSRNPLAAAATVEEALKASATLPGTVSRDGRAVALVNARQY